MAGFRYRYSLNGGRPRTQSFVMQDTETLTKGDIISIQSGLADLAATGDSDHAGAMIGPADPKDAKIDAPGVVEGTSGSTVIQCITSPDAVYGVVDANARNAGATLDIAGATGAQTIASSSNKNFVVVERKLQTADETRVMINIAKHYLGSAL